MFSVFDVDYYGLANQYVADGFLMFKDIPSNDKFIPQKELILTVLQDDGEISLI